MFEILIDSQTLDQRVNEMSRALFPEPPLLVAVLEGARTFAERLLAHAGRDSDGYETIRISSYGDASESSGTISLVSDVDCDVSGRRVVLLEDIVDTGRTVHFLFDHLRARGAASVEVHTLLSKPSRRVIDVPLAAVGFEIPDEFVVGYGMDLAGRYRDLPHIAIYDEAKVAALPEGEELGACRPSTHPS